MAVLAGPLKASREWHGEVAVGSARLGYRRAGEVGDPHAEILRRQRELLRVESLRASPAPKGLVGELPLRRADLPTGSEADIRLTVGRLDTQGQLGELLREFLGLGGGDRLAPSTGPSLSALTWPQ